MSEKPVRQRLDLRISRVTGSDDPNHFHFEMEFDPRRYEWLERDGERCLYDRFEKALIPEQVLQQMTSQMAGLPLYHQPPLIRDSAEYVASRHAAIAQQLEGIALDEDVDGEPSSEFLDARVGSELGFAILCIDLVGSTRLSTAIDVQRYERIVSTYLYETSRVVPLFRGQVLKYTGDGLIAYFAEPSFNSMNDLAIDCALTMRRLIWDGLNPALRAHGFPLLSTRIGLEAGDAFITLVGSPSTKRHSDIVGEVVNVASKIQAICPPEGICLGEAAISALHVSWRQLTRVLASGPEWQVRRRDGSLYAVSELIAVSPRANA